MAKQRIKYNQLSQLINDAHKEAKKSYSNSQIEIKDKIITDICLYSLNIPVHFKDCIFVQGFTFFSCKITELISMERCSFKEISFFDTIISESIYIFSSKIKESLSILGKNDLNVVSIGLKYCKQVIIGDPESQIKDFSLGGEDDIIIKEIIISPSSIKERLLINNLTIERLNLSYSNLNSEINVFNCKINSILFDDLRNNGTSKLLNCKSHPIKGKKSHLIINESNLGVAEFLQFDFASFSELNILNSSISECLFINTTWANNISSFLGDQMKDYGSDRLRYRSKLYQYQRIIDLALKKINTNINLKQFKETPTQLENKREVYKQIKYALSKQGDLINEQFFHGLEMNAYNKTLKPSIKNIWIKSILTLSRLTSNYGQSFSRPLLFMLFANGALFLILVFFNKIPEVSFVRVGDYTFNSIGNTWSNFIKFLNPLHGNEPELKSWSFIADVFIRIISSYSIYNLIRATRRFIK